MGALDLSFHLFAFAAPALAVALVLAVAGRVLFPRQQVLIGWWGQVALNAAVGLAVLALGLWHFGVDGKMATYATLVCAAGAAQWVGIAGWRA